MLRLKHHIALLMMRPDRAVFWLSFYGLILIAWMALFLWVIDLGPDMGANITGQGAVAFGGIGQAFGAPFAWAVHGDPTWGVLAGMWALMGMAMMMPTLIPYQQTLNDLTLSLPLAGRWGVRLAFMGAYIGVWAGFGLIAAGVQMWLYGWGWVDVVGVATVPSLTFGLLLLAGIYQFTP